MAVYMVERDLPGVTMDQLAAAQKAAIETGKQFTEEGKNVRYIRTTFVPGEAMGQLRPSAPKPPSPATTQTAPSTSMPATHLFCQSRLLSVVV